MFLERFPEGALRVAILLGLALAATALLRRAPSAARRLVLALALGGALALPAIAALAPALRVEAPAAITSLRGRPVAEPLADDGPLPAPSPRAATTASRPAPSRLDTTTLLAGLWALGALFVLARLAVGLGQARAMVRRSWAAPAWSAAIARAERTMGLRADVRTSDEVDAPAVTGVLAPVVLVPRASDAWSDDRRHAVLLHELAHVRQRDCLAQIVAQLACAVHWFDPLAWIAARRLRVERELAADDAVIAAGARASSYAEDLLAIAGEAPVARDVPAGALGMAERSELAVRVTAIVAPGRARRPLSGPRTALLATGAAAVLFVVACTTPDAQRPPAAAAPAPTPEAKPAPITAASTIDPKLQAIADEEIARTVAEWQAPRGAIVVLDPATGEILANAGRDHGAPADVGTRHAYVTGSTLKPITLAAALDEGVVTLADRFDCENGKRTIEGKVLHDAEPYGTLTIPEMMAVSTNIGFSKVFDRLGGERLDRWLRRFHFGAAPAIEGAAAGEMPARAADGSWDGAVAAIGEAMTATPVQMAAAYAAFANGGAYVAPTLTRRAGAPPREQLIKPETARAVLTTLDEVVNGARGTGKLARVAGVRVAGKTGTAEWSLPGSGDGRYGSFVGLVPADRPRFIIVVGVESPRDDAPGGKVAAPVFARVAARALGG